MQRENLKKGNYSEWERRSKLYGSSLKSVLFKNLPEVVNEHLHNWHTKIILESIKNKANLRILDVGCGYGRLSIPIIERFPNADIIGMDVSENFVKLYKENTNRSAFIGAVENISPELGEFDYIICVTVLMYVADKNLDKAVANLLFHLKPDGRLIIIEPDHSGLPFLNGFGLFNLIRKKDSTNAVNIGGQCFRKNEIEKIITKAGGTILNEQRLPITSLCILPMYLIGKIFPSKFARGIFKIIHYLDEILGRVKLPSLYIARIILKK